jgi:hypothetical protein
VLEPELVPELEPDLPPDDVVDPLGQLGSGAGLGVA